MKTGRFSEPQTLAILRQAEGVSLYPALPGTWNEHGVLLQMAIQIWRHGRVDDQPDEGWRMRTVG